MTINEKAIERYKNNINKPLQCAGFYLNTALLERIHLGYQIESVQKVQNLGNSDLNVYQIIHSKN